MDTSGNPALGDGVLNRVETATTGQVMSAKGTYAKTALLLGVLIISSILSMRWLDTLTGVSPWLFFWLPVIVSFVLAMVMNFSPKKAVVLAIPYAILQGIYLGVLSAIFASAYDGIVGAAVLVTLAVFLAVLIGYQVGVLKASPRFQRIIIVAMLGITVYYALSLLLSLFGITTPLIASYSGWGIAFSVLVVITAALSLVLDFDFIERASNQRYPKYFEWYGAFGLIVGLIWLYAEILRLLAKLMSRRNQ